MNCLSTLKCLACIPRIARVSRIGLSDGLYSSSLAESAEDNATNKMTIPGHNGAASHQPKGDKNNSKMKKDFKVLMLHGFTQSGTLFRAKTRALEKLLAKALAPHGLALTCLYPTGPHRLNVRDVPGYAPKSGAEEEEEETEASDLWAWFRRRDLPGSEATYWGIDEGIRTVAATIHEAGGVDGVLGFSQGGAFAALVASALEKPHRDVPAEHAGWVAALRDANGRRRIRFAAIYSGFFAVDPTLGWCFEPPIQTPTVHFTGSLDMIVEEDRSQALVDRCVKPIVVVHPGGHFVPISKEWAMALAGFVKAQAQGDDDDNNNNTS